MSFSNYLENEILDHIVGEGAYTMPTAYVALFESDPTDAGSGTETTYTGYARVATSGATWNSASGGSIDNAAAIEFGESSSSATITHFALYDALTNGNMLVHGNVDPDVSIASGDTPRFNIGALTISLD